MHIIAPDVGGGFGSKIYIYNEEVLCAWASKKVKRPVRWTAERTESLPRRRPRPATTSPRPSWRWTPRGKFLGLRVHTLANLGGYPSLFSTCVPTYLYATLLSGQYVIPNIYAEVEALYTNTAPVDAYRGAGRPEATYVVERIVEVAAREMGMDPAELRKRNFIGKDQYPYQSAGDPDL